MAVSLLRRPRVGPLDGVDPLFSELLSSRGLQHATELDYALTGLIKPAGLKDFSRAVGLIENAMAKRQSILIVGDYDADGATSV